MASYDPQSIWRSGHVNRVRDVHIPFNGPPGRDGEPIVTFDVPLDIAIGNPHFFEEQARKAHVAKLLAISVTIGAVIILLIVWLLWIHSSPVVSEGEKESKTSATTKVRIKNTTEVEGVDGTTESGQTPAKDSELEKLEAELKAEKEAREAQEQRLKELETEKDKPKEKEKEPSAKKTSASQPPIFQPEKPTKPYSNYDDNSFILH